MEKVNFKEIVNILKIDQNERKHEDIQSLGNLLKVTSYFHLNNINRVLK